MRIVNKTTYKQRHARRDLLDDAGIISLRWIPSSEGQGPEGGD